MITMGIDRSQSKIYMVGEDDYWIAASLTEAIKFAHECHGTDPIEDPFDPDECYKVEDHMLDKLLYYDEEIGTRSLCTFRQEMERMIADPSEMIPNIFASGNS